MRKWEDGLPHPPISTTPGLAQQAKHCLRQLVGLGQNRSTCLLHNLVLGQVSRFCGEVSILDTTTGCRDVFCDVLQVADGVLEAVLHRTEISALRVDVLDRLVDSQYGFLRTF